MSNSLLGTILMLILMVTITIGVIVIMVKLLVAIFSNTFVKLISLLLIGFFIYSVYDEYKVTHDSSLLIMIAVSVIVGFIILSIKGESRDSGSYSGSHSYDERPSAPKRENRSKNVCPRCDCEYIYIPENVVPTGEYNDYEGKGFWQYYTEDGMTKSRWIQPMHHDPVYKKVGGYWECPKCGRRK